MGIYKQVKTTDNNSGALTEELRVEDKPWMNMFGQLRDLYEETARINQIIEEEFGQINPEDWK